MIVAFDIENYKKDEEGNYQPILDGTGENFTMGCIMKETGATKVFTDKDMMWNYLIALGENEFKRGKKLTVYGHNISYDFYQIAKLQDKNIRYYSERPFIASYYKTIKITKTEEEFEKWKIYAKMNHIYYKVTTSELGLYDIEYNKEIIKFLDNMNLFGMSLKKVGDIIGLPKLDMPTEIGKRLTKEKIKEMAIYCKRDCEIVIKGVRMLKDKLKDDNVNIKNLCTFNQIAINYIMNEIRNESGNENMLYINKEGKATEFTHKTRYAEYIHEAYRGGFVRAWKIGKIGKCNYIDCNSLYPYSAIIMRFPKLNSERLIMKPLDIYTIEDLIGKIGISRVMIKNESDKLGLLITRTPTKGYVPKMGKYLIGTWTNRELKEAIENGYKIINVEWSILWDEDKNLLKEVFKKLYEKRMNAEDRFNNRFYKDIMNRGIGKFGQYKKNRELFIDDVEKIKEYLEDGYKVLRGVSDDSTDIIISKEEDKYEIKKYYAPIIPTLITAEARCYMYNMYKKIPLDKLAYTDTDSIIWEGSKDLLKNFKIGEGLGEFKIVNDDLTGEPLIEKEGLIYGTKTKMIGNSFSVSGVFKSSITKEDFENGIIKNKKMLGIRSGGIENAGRFIEENRDLERQTEQFIEEKEIMEQHRLYIDEGIKDVSFFLEDIKKIGVLPA